MAQAASTPRVSGPAPAPWRWARENLFSSPGSAVLTVAALAFILVLARGVVAWALTARWGVVPDNFQLLMVGPYPQAQLWRVWTGLVLVCLLAGFQWGRTATPRPGALAALVAVAAVFALSGRGHPSGVLVPLAAVAAGLGLLAGRRLRLPSRVEGRLMGGLWLALFLGVIVLISADFGRGGVQSNLWGGLLLTTVLATVSIFASFPLGVLLAVGRTSKLPVVSALCVGFIELMRGVPLVGVLFLAQLFVPLFIPGANIDPVVRAIVGFTLFTAAYLAENIRGGLQSVAAGQAEAARALGLTGSQTLTQVVLPQALRAVIPANVGQFITLFKDTSLVAIIGLTDLLRIGQAITANPEYTGTYKEVYVAVALIYAVFSYSMAVSSRRLERRLAAGGR